MIFSLFHGADVISGYLYLLKIVFKSCHNPPRFGFNFTIRCVCVRAYVCVRAMQCNPISICNVFRCDIYLFDMQVCVFVQDVRFCFHFPQGNTQKTNTIRKANFACLTIFKCCLPGELFTSLVFLHVGYEPHSFPSVWLQLHESVAITQVWVGKQPMSLHVRPYSIHDWKKEKVDWACVNGSICSARFCGSTHLRMRLPNKPQLPAGAKYELDSSLSSWQRNHLLMCYLKWTRYS